MVGKTPLLAPAPHANLRWPLAAAIEVIDLRQLVVMAM
jgi:hypothetical protein